MYASNGGLRVPVLDHAALENADVQGSPFPFTVIDSSFIDSRVAHSLSESFATEDFVRSERQGDNVGKNYLMFNYVLVKEGVVDEERLVSLSPIWQELIGELRAPEYRRVMERLTGVDLRDTDLTIRIDRYEPGCWIQAHLDKPDKVVTHLLYFNQEWSEEWGGDFRVLRSSDMDDCHQRVLPALGRSIVMAWTENAWHAVSPVTPHATEGRMSVLVHFVQR